MSTIVKDINDALKSEITAELGSAVQELQYIYDVTMNNTRGIKDGFGVKILSGGFAEGVTKSYNTLHSFEVILTTTSGRQNDDSDLIAALLTLYERAHKIIKRIYNNKLGLAASVLQVNNHNINEPEFFDENGFIVLRFQIDILYRILL